MPIPLHIDMYHPLLRAWSNNPRHCQSWVDYLGVELERGVPSEDFVGDLFIICHILRIRFDDNRVQMARMLKRHPDWNLIPESLLDKIRELAYYRPSSWAEKKLEDYL